MFIKTNEELPQIIWIAAYPPCPPFAGYSFKTLSGIRALSKLTHVELITFAHEADEQKIQSSLQQFCGVSQVKIHLIEPDEQKKWASSLLKRKFLSSQKIREAELGGLLEDLEWNKKNCLLIFDDIILASFADQYGSNSILSPHDCISAMFKDHFRLLPYGIPKIKKLVQYFIARHLEKRYYHRALLIHVVTQRDRFLLEKINPYALYQVIPIPDYFEVEDGNRIPDWDIMIWGNLEIPSVLRGVNEFLKQFKMEDNILKNIRIILVGRVSENRARFLIGEDHYSLCEYSSTIEDEHGKRRQAKIILIPDKGGAGIKNRVINVLASGYCLACLYPQMEGLEQACDVGAINAFDMHRLYKKVKYVLDQGTYNKIGVAGRKIYYEYNDLIHIEKLWLEMIHRAVTLREFNKGM